MHRARTAAALLATAALATACAATPLPPATSDLGTRSSAPAAPLDLLTADDRRFAIVENDRRSRLEIRDLAGATLTSIDLPGRFRHARAGSALEPDALSADGSVLVLEEATPTRPPSRFLVVDLDQPAAHDLVELDGRFDYDALSPTGETLFVTEHLGDGSYRIRPFAIAQRRLADPVVVKSPTPDEPMQGVPMARASEAAGDWVYTLYDGGEHAFVHALNTVERFALCLDLPHGAHSDSWSLMLERPGLVVAHGSRAGDAFAVDRDSASVRRLDAQAGS